MDEKSSAFENVKKFIPNKFLLLIALLVIVIGILGLMVASYEPAVQNTTSTQTQTNATQPSPAPTDSATSDPNANNSPSIENRPQISITGGRLGYSGGGMIALASTDEPSIQIGGYDIKGEASVSLYEANQDALLNYLTHDKDGKKTKKTVDVGSLRHITDLKYQITSDYGKEPKLLLPLAETGIWAIQIKLKDTTEYGFIVRSNFGVVAKEGDNEHIFWGQNFKSKRSVNGGSLKVYSLLDSAKEIANTNFGNDGIAKSPLSADADIALAQIGEDRVVLPINLRYFNTKEDGYKPFRPKSRQTKYFIFTDRPLYKPGDKVYFKAILRDDDDARYTIPVGQASVRFYSSYNDDDLLLEKSYPISADGTINGEYDLPAAGVTGQFRVVLEIPGSTKSDTWFDVEYFRKPEYSINVTSPKTELTVGDQSSFTIAGNYFSGQPLANQKVKYTIYSGDFYDYDYVRDRSSTVNNDYRYGNWGGDTIKQGEVVLDKKGQATVALKAEPTKKEGRNQVFSIEAEYDNGSGNPAFSRKNVLVYAGDFDIFRQEGNYSTKVGTEFALPTVLMPHYSTKVAQVNLTAKIHRENWIPYQEKDKKYPSYRKEEEDLTPIKATTDAEGNATIKFTPKKVGSYKITVEGRDARGNLVSKVFYAYASTEDSGVYSKNLDNDLTVQADKELYLPTDTARLTINSRIADRDILLALERGRVNRFQIVHLTGQSTTVDLPLVGTDIPNIFAKVTSFSDHTLNSNSANLIVSAETKQLNVKTTPDRQSYKPGDMVNVSIETTDATGTPTPAEVALWSVDKAIFELTDNPVGKIFDTFWSERYDNTEQAHSLEGINVTNAEMGGGDGGVDRIIFKDTAYWNPSIHTDSSGKAQISFKLPDNLTTWVVAAIGSTSDTRVGQTTSEVKVSKDIVVRPLLPNLLREGDEAVISAYVHNFTDAAASLTTNLEFNAGTVSRVSKQTLKIPAQDYQLASWKVLAQTVKEKASLVFSALSSSRSEGDSVTQEIPVRAFGFSEKKAQTGAGSKTFTVELSPDSREEQSKVTLSLAPSLFGTLPKAVNYLVTYPYGCAEQTTSRLVASLVAKSNPDIFRSSLENKNIDATISEQIKQLATLQQGDGGWSWWISGNSDPFVSAYVVEYLLVAKQAGVQVDKSLITQAQGYFERLEKQSPENTVAQTYALTLLGSPKRQAKLSNLDNLKPDILALAVTANYQNGDKNAQTNGLAKLVSLSKTQGDSAFWEAGNKLNFGSVDASTALAVRALLMTGGDKDLLTKAIRYLARNRQQDYWSNTFATAQVTQALVNYAKTNQELTPNYTYSVTLDGKQIAQGSVNNSKQVINDVIIPISEVKADGSELVVIQTGTGQLYSTLIANEFHTDRKAKGTSSGLEVSREYVSDQGPGEPLSVGDEVTVKVTVSGLKTKEYYGAIADELPAGLIPVNQSFKNQQYGQNPDAYYKSYDVTDRVITENGMILSLYQIPDGQNTFSYKARAVSEGTFIAPPAIASLIYAPEIFGRSAVQTVKIHQSNDIVATDDQSMIGVVILLLILVGAILVVVVLRKKFNNTRKYNDEESQSL